MMPVLILPWYPPAAPADPADPADRALADEAVVMDVCGDREDPLPGIDEVIGQYVTLKPGGVSPPS